MLNDQQAEFAQADGIGEVKSTDKTEILKIFLTVRKDREIPEFDAIAEIKFWSNGFKQFAKYHEALLKHLAEYGGLFIEDALKLKDKDVFSLAGENPHPKDIFPIPLLIAVKKAILDYFEKSGQEQRFLKASQEVICKCKHVTDHEIKEAVIKGFNTFELVQKYTLAGTGCNSCINKTKELVEQYRKPAL